MSKLRNYELSFWRDVIINNEPQEQRLYVFGADSLTTQSRALEPKLKRNVNGSNELTFKMYYQYIDNITGEKVDNPFCKDLINEAKIKLHFQNNWYDMIIKGVDKKTSNKTITYTATDLHINELSKNGFGLTLDTKTETSIGTIEELANRIFEDTDWQVDTSEKIPQTIDETLVEVRILQDFYATQLRNDITEAPTELPNQLIPADSIIYLFYSCCKNKSDRLQFVYVADTIEKDQDRIIVNKNSQYYVDGITYVETSTSKKYGIFLPNNLCGNIPTMKISSEYRGARFVFSAKSLFNKTLDKYITVYKDQSGKEWHGYTETELVAPVLIQNLVTNNDFKTDTGWYGRYWFDVEDGRLSSYHNKGLLYNAGVLCSNTNTTTGQDTSMMGDLLSGQYQANNNYKSYIRLDFKGINQGTNQPYCSSVVINSGFYDYRSSIKNLSPNQKFILLYHIKKSENVVPPNFTVYVGEADYYAVADAQNSIFRKGPFLEFNSNEAKSMAREDESYSGYRYVVASVSPNYQLTQEEFGRTKTQIFIVPDDPSVDSTLELFDFQIFPYIEKEGEFTKSDDKILLPKDGAKEIRVRTNYCYFDPQLPQNKEASKKEQMSISIYHDEPRSDLLYQYSVGAEKVATLNVSKSNYFNACQKLCEVFECWADFDIVHDDEGYIIEKWVRFKNYIGQDNFAGFRYGVNLKDISRKDDSKKIVSKLMVTSNTNKHAKNGYCAIGRAGSNETGEDYIYDFTYYINQKMLNPTDLVDLFYDTDNGQGQDLDLILPTHPGINKPINCQGYYTRLQKLNTEMNKFSEEMSKYSNLIMEAKKNITTYEASLEQIRSQLADDINGFRQTTGFDYTEISSKEETKAERQTLVLQNASVRSYLTRITTGLSSEQDYIPKLRDAEEEFEQYSTNYEQLEAFFENRRNQKKALNLEFFKRYYRFIQEGTWTDNDQVDDEKYYNDAISVAYNSSMPQVSYTFNALALENIEGYEGFNLQLADKTFIEDTEYFGYDEKGNPYREQVVITEITYSLEEINKDSYKIQNYKNQFQDLFQTITASVQNVNYTSGAWNNAADFTEASDAKKSSFLQGALNHADTVLSNMGEQSVVWDEKGITITDNLHPSQQLRIIAGGIFLRDQDDKDLGWKAGITPQGINAKLITAGQLNTGIIQIMNGDEPYFRWDDHGITAYDFQENKVGYTTTYNTKKGVRFDRFGIYGYDMGEEGFNVEGDNVKDGQLWHPTSIDEVRDNSLFSLTWEGLLLKIGTGQYLSTELVNGVKTTSSVKHHSFASIGKVDGTMYYGWKEDDPWEPDDIKHNTDDTGFVKVFSAGTTGEDGNYEERMAIFDNGTLLCKQARIEGDLKTTQGTIGGWDINTKSIGSSFSPDDESNLLPGCIFLNSASNTSNNWIEAYNTAAPTDTSLQFSISKVGKLTAKNATISSGFIGTEEKGWKINDNSLYANTNTKIYSQEESFGLALARWSGRLDEGESKVKYGPVLAIGMRNFNQNSTPSVEKMETAPFCIRENGYGHWGQFTMGAISFQGEDLATIWLYNNENQTIYRNLGLDIQKKSHTDDKPAVLEIRREGMIFKQYHDQIHSTGSTTTHIHKAGFTFAPQNTGSSSSSKECYLQLQCSGPGGMQDLTLRSLTIDNWYHTGFDASRVFLMGTESLCLLSKNIQLATPGTEGSLLATIKGTITLGCTDIFKISSNSELNLTSQKKIKMSDSSGGTTSVVVHGTLNVSGTFQIDGGNVWVDGNGFLRRSTPAS